MEQSRCSRTRVWGRAGNDLELGCAEQKGQSRKMLQGRCVGQRAEGIFGVDVWGL